MRTVCAPGLLMVCASGVIGTTHGEVIDSAAASNRVTAAAADCVPAGAMRRDVWRVTGCWKNARMVKPHKEVRID